jgi:hypothetical protein
VDFVLAVIRHPVTRFFAVGLALYAWNQTLGAPPPEPPFPPGTVVSDEQLLARLGMDLDPLEDEKIRKRLVVNLEETEGAQGRDEAQMVEDAVALGMLETDPATQMRLAHLERNELGREAWLKPRTPDEIAAYYAEHTDEFAEPARASFEQRWFATREEALARAPLPADVPDLDETMSPRVVEKWSASDIEKTFDAEVARAAFSAPLREWTEPLASDGGFRIVRVRERLPAKPAPPLAGNEDRVERALRSARTEAAIREGVAKLRRQYQLPAEEPR